MLNMIERQLFCKWTFYEDIHKFIFNKFITNLTSTSDHSIIKIETSKKILEEKQNHQIKKSNLNYRDFNFFN